MKPTRPYLNLPDFSKPSGYSNFRYQQRNCPDVLTHAERPAIFKFKAALLLISAVALLAAFVPEMRAQSALDGFDPSANGTIRAVVVQPDGKILIGGDFTTLSPNGALPVTRNHIARVNPDGTLDTAFNPNATGVVDTIAVQADGKVLVGGQFNGANSIGGQTRNRIARLDAVTGAADSWNPNANLEVFTIAVQADGKILAGGDFVDFGDGTPSIGGQIRNFIARLDPTNGLADSWNPNAKSTVRTIVVQANGKILAGGDFSGANSIGGQTRNRIARLDATSGLATDAFNPDANGIVESIAVQADGKILVGGRFFGANSIGGQMRNRIARVDATNGLADSFDPNASNFVLAIVVQADGKILAGGLFSGATGIGGQLRNNIARMETDGGLDRTVIQNASPGPDGSGASIYAIAVQPDGKILIGGDFTAIGNVPRNYIARLNRDGTLDTTFNPNAGYVVFALTLQSDGKILVGGQFAFIGGQNRSGIARLDPVTGMADSFDPHANAHVNCIVVQSDGRILVGGAFTGANSFGGQTRNRIARVNSDGTLDPTFDPNAQEEVDTIALQDDGKILVGGVFSGTNSIGGQTRNRIARLDPTTGLADSFDPNANDQVVCILVQRDGKILVGGAFHGANGIGGQNHSGIARLDAAGMPDSFGAPLNEVFSIALQGDGRVLVGEAAAMVRLDASTGSADLFAPVSGSVTAITLPADGKILAGGAFLAIGGQNREAFARLTNDTAAFQNLAATQSSVTWTRGGSSPQFVQVTFEYSTDNVNYTLLGNGTATGSNWTLTGLSLPTGQNIYIRARGYYFSGVQSGSRSIAESVRNAFITLPPAPSQVVSRKIHGTTAHDIVLPLTGTPGIECRSGGGTNDYQLVFTFPSVVTFSQAAVAAGAGSINGSSGNGTTTVTVNLTGVTNVQQIVVSLRGVTDGSSAGDLNVPMNVLLGDTNGNGTVNSSDVGQTKAKAGQAVDASNFREDVTVSDSINSSDVSFVKAKSGTALPPITTSASKAPSRR